MSMSDEKKTVAISDFMLYSIIAEYYGVDIDDVDIKICIDTEGQPYIDCCEITVTEPEREVSFASHW